MKFLTKLYNNKIKTKLLYNPFYKINKPYSTFMQISINNFYFINFLFKQYKWALLKGIKYKNLSYRLSQHSYSKKFLSILNRHGNKLTVIQKLFYNYYNFFLFLSLKKKLPSSLYHHTHTILYNVTNYKWLRNIFNLWMWVYTWLDFIFKYKIKQPKVKAGRKKKKNKSTSYIYKFS